MGSLGGETKIITVIGARPNFMKVAPLCHAIAEHNRGCSKRDHIQHTLVHTGQHYDDSMSGDFLRCLELPKPDFNLGIGSGSHAFQVAHAMIELEKIYTEIEPDWVIAVGDVNAALSASITAKKMGLKVAHIEAGLRSNDWTMPEEINRILVDRIADLHLTPSEDANENLRAEGIGPDRIKLAGNLMIDTLDKYRDQAKKSDPMTIIQDNRIDKKSATLPEKYAIVTLHRPSNVDQAETLHHLVCAFRNVAKRCPIVFPVHPRTLQKLESYGLLSFLAETPNVILLQPLDYAEMLTLLIHSRLVITDSGGLQEEALVLGLPCLTLRSNTERPITLTEFGGTNLLVGNNSTLLESAFDQMIEKTFAPVRPPLWDGRTGKRIVRILMERRDQSPHSTSTTEATLR